MQKFYVGDKFLINVPMESKYEVKEFRIKELYPHFALLTDGIINVCYKYVELEHWTDDPTKKFRKGCWN